MNRREMLKLGAAMAVAPSVPAAAPKARAMRLLMVPAFVVAGGKSWSSGRVTMQALNEDTGMWEDV